METKGRRGSRVPLASAPSATEIPGEAAPQIVPPLPSAPEASQEADDLDAPSGDSQTTPALIEEAVDRAPEVPQEMNDLGAPGGDSQTALALAQEAVERAPEPPDAPQAAGDFRALDRDSLTALAKSQVVLAQELTALGFEIAGLACSGFDTAARIAARLLAVRTPSDAARLQAEYMRSSLALAAAGSARLSNLGVKIAARAAEPLVAQLGRNWLAAVRRAG